MKKVLIVEDNGDIMDIVDYILIGCGFKVLHANERLTIEEIIKMNP